MMTSHSSKALTPADAPFTVEINPLSSEVDAGESFDALFQATYNGVEQLVNVGVMIPIPDYITTFVARVVDEQTNGVQTVGTRKTPGYLQWRGRKQQCGKLTLRLCLKTKV